MAKSKRPSSKKAPVKKAVKRTVKAPARRLPAFSESPKQSSARPVVSRARVYNLTRDIPPDKYFVLANGRPVKNVAELAAILDVLEDHVFNHHVSPDRNDFHSWIKDVFQDIELARKIAGVDNKKHLQLVIYRHIAGHD